MGVVLGVAVLQHGDGINVWPRSPLVVSGEAGALGDDPLLAHRPDTLLELLLLPVLLDGAPVLLDGAPNAVRAPQMEAERACGVDVGVQRAGFAVMLGQTVSVQHLTISWESCPYAVPSVNVVVPAILTLGVLLDLFIQLDQRDLEARVRNCFCSWIVSVSTSMSGRPFPIGQTSGPVGSLGAICCERGVREVDEAR